MAAIPAITVPCPACSEPVLLPVTAETVLGSGRLASTTVHIDTDPLDRHRLTHHTRETDMVMTPTIGRIVHYRLSEDDAKAINALPMPGNTVKAGDLVAAIVVRVWSASTCNLRLVLDGDGEYWATSCSVGDEQRQWNWPQHISL